MTGIEFVIEQLGRALQAAEQRIALLEAELAASRQQAAAEGGEE